MANQLEIMPHKIICCTDLINHYITVFTGHICFLNENSPNSHQNFYHVIDIYIKKTLSCSDFIHESRKSQKSENEAQKIVVLTPL